MKKPKRKRTPFVKLSAAESALWCTPAEGARARREALRARKNAAAWSLVVKHQSWVEIRDSHGAVLQTIGKVGGFSFK
jgi:hypothetical protein